jgi:hypothetical protein
MKAKHKPAPWRYEATSGFDYGSTQYWVPGVCVNIDREADARLIASAPELLEALKDVLGELKKYELVGAGGYIPKTSRLIEKATQAIAKAEGA